MTPNDIYSEDTQYNPEYSNTLESNTPPPVPESAQPKAPAKKGNNTAAKVAVGAGTGVVVGALAATLMSMGRGDGPDQEDDKAGDGDSGTKVGAEVYTDGEIEVAHNVNDSMSFSEAFAAARQEVGPGGCFEWHGQVYGTYTANEWNTMSAGEKQDYEDHFNWNKFQSTGSQQQEQQQEQQHVAEQHTSSQSASMDDVVVVESNDEENIAGKHDVVSTDDYVDDGGDVDIQVLGIEHSSQTGAYYASLTVGDQEVVLIDVDSDMQFDYLTADVNHNNIIEDNEIEDIQGQNITVDGLMQAGNIDQVVEMYPETDGTYSDDMGADDMPTI